MEFSKAHCYWLIWLVIVGWMALFPGGRKSSGQELPKHWELVLAAAKKEGKLVVSAPTGAATRQVVVQGFQAEYPDIHMEYSGVSGRETIPRIMEERRFGRKMWDIIIGGPSSLKTLRDANALVELPPALILPQVKNDEYWYGGVKFGFVDRDKKYVFAFNNNLVVTGWVNRSIIKSQDLSSPRQLIESRFKGKIAMDDPRVPGPGSLRLASLLHAYGESFAKKLLTEQDVVFIRNYPQLAEWIVRGRYPIAIGPTPAQVERFFEQGLGRHLEVLNSPETTVITAEAGNISLIEGAPHPNAAKVFINWFLAKNAQQAWSDATANNSRRTDVTPGDKATFPDPKRLGDYMLDNEEFRVELVEKARRLAKTWIGSR